MSQSDGNNETYHRKGTVTHEQTLALIDFMEKHPFLAINKCRPKANKLWKRCAEAVNAVNGPKKTPTQCSKMFSDWKYRTRRKALELKIAAEGKGTSPEEMTSLEERVLKLIDEKSLNYTKLLKEGDPLADEDDSSDDDDEFLAPPRKATAASTSGTNLQPQPTGPSIIFRKDKNQFEILGSSVQKEKEPFKDNSGSSTRKRRRPDTSGDTSGCEDRKPRLNGRGEVVPDSDEEDEIPMSTLLSLEKRKLASAERLADAACAVRDELARIGDVLTQIKDAIVNR